MIFLKEDGMHIKFVRSIQLKVGIEFPSTLLKRFQEDNSMDKKLVQADNEQLPLTKMKTDSKFKKIFLVATCCQERLKKTLT